MKKFKRTEATPRPETRRVLRREVDWPTRYTIEGSRGGGWRACRIRDLSREGAGVELFDTHDEETSGNRVVLEVEVPPAVFRLVGEVRHVGPGSEGGVHVGLQFSSLAAVERDMLDTLLGHGSAAPSAR